MGNKDHQIYYYDVGSLLVINPKGQMRKLYTPFRVLCIETVIPYLNKRSWVFVDEVRKDKREGLLYVVGGRTYSYQLFEIIIHF